MHLDLNRHRLDAGEGEGAHTGDRGGLQDGAQGGSGCVAPSTGLTRDGERKRNGLAVAASATMFA